MAFTTAEREARHRAIQETTKKDHLQALLLIGDTNVGPGSYGDLRYYTDMFIIFYRQVVVIFPESEPVLFAYSEITRQAAARRSSVKDCRFTENLIVDAAKLLKERGISTGRIGINFEMLPLAWYNFYDRNYPRSIGLKCTIALCRFAFNEARKKRGCSAKELFWAMGGLKLL